VCSSLCFWQMQLDVPLHSGGVPTAATEADAFVRVEVALPPQSNPWVNPAAPVNTALDVGAVVIKEASGASPVGLCRLNQVDP
jgi:hypothetical protein